MQSSHWITSLSTHIGARKWGVSLLVPFSESEEHVFPGEGVWVPKPENEQMSRKRVKTKEEPKQHMSTLGSRLFTVVLPQQQWTSLLAVFVILFNAHEHRGQSY